LKYAALGPPLLCGLGALPRLTRCGLCGVCRGRVVCACVCVEQTLERILAKENLRAMWNQLLSERTYES
jgi:hypothetical protein